MSPTGLVYVGLHFGVADALVFRYGDKKDFYDEGSEASGQRNHRQWGRQPEAPSRYPGDERRAQAGSRRRAEGRRGREGVPRSAANIKAEAGPPPVARRNRAPAGGNHQ